nr:immunoglobulin light chain junction region [Homo sapiens]MCD26931.1 immunoglobulin light chain junction region [Homo sapiens]
CNSRDSSGNHL